MFDIGLQELLILMVLALIVFGPDKLPDLGRRLGRAMREFRRASDEFRSTIETNLHFHEEVPLPPSAAVPESPSIAAGGAGVTPAPAGAGDAATAVAPAATHEGEADAAAVAIAPIEPFSARRGGRLLHRTTCGWVSRIIEADRIVLKTAAEGADLGLVPCPVCDPMGAEAHA